MDASPDSLHVLIVEDNDINREVTRFMLRRLGHSSSTACHGRDALTRCQAEDFDLILMDCQMPVMDGFEATRRIRAGEAGERHRDTPVLALTAGLVADHVERCNEVGMDGFLAKPLYIDALADGLRPFLPGR